MAEVRKSADENDEQGDSYSDEETLDPRVKEELERLNKATDEINGLEVQLDEARAAFRQSLNESTNVLNCHSKKLGSCIEKARPYYEARQTAKRAQQAIQDAALKFERANSMLAAAKEMVDVAEHGLIVEKRTFDANWQEMLNHATMKVNEAEHDRAVVELEHQRTAAEFDEAERLVKKLQRSLKKNISKSRPYFDAKHQFNQQLEDQKIKVTELEKRVLKAKRSYSMALKTLEAISDRIHKQRSSGRCPWNQEVMGRCRGPSADSPNDSCPDFDETVQKEYVVLPHRNNSIKRHNVPHPRVRALSDSAVPDPHSILLAYESTEHLDEEGWDTGSQSTAGDDTEREDDLEFSLQRKENCVAATQTDDPVISSHDITIRVHDDANKVVEMMENVTLQDKNETTDFNDVATASKTESENSPTAETAPSGDTADIATASGHENETSPSTSDTAPSSVHQHVTDRVIAALGEEHETYL
ncbi:SH3 domain-binding protein 5-like [Ptychodera flava]|uniref:SH3 domain-binding protein 5-like n=1 Tax=Ptychodera flava TaxID=63121 RepID=UPI00396A4E27